jgi:hypothetical protein
VTRDELDSLEPGDIVISRFYASPLSFDRKMKNGSHSIYNFISEDSGEFQEICSKCDEGVVEDLVLEASCQAAKAFDKELKELIDE